MITISEDRLYRHIGEYLKAVRQARKLSQEQVAQGVDMLRTSISNIEAGRQRLPLQTLYRICGVLSVEPASALPELATVQIVVPEAAAEPESPSVPPERARGLKRLVLWLTARRS